MAQLRGSRWRKNIGQQPMTINPPARTKPNERSCFRDGVRCLLIENKLFPPIDVGFKRFLIGLVHQLISQNQQINLSSHETSICVFRRTDDRFTANVERRIHNHSVACEFLKTLQQVVVLPVRLFMYGLHSCRVVDMRDSRNIYPRPFQKTRTLSRATQRGRMGGMILGI